MRKHLYVPLFIIAVFALAAFGLGNDLVEASGVFPPTIALPDGFQPEGVVTGYGSTIYAGSLATGAIFEADLRTGSGGILVPAEAGQIAVGLSFDPRAGTLFVAGGPVGNGSVYDVRSGELLARYQFASQPTFVNDVIVTREAAYFTDSANPVLYRVALGPAGTLPLSGSFETIPVSGIPFDSPFNVNGIEATDNSGTLFVVHSGRGEIYRVDPQSGEATLVDLGGQSLTSGDGLLLHGSTLYVMRNRLNEIAVVELDPGYESGEITGTITDSDFDVPTTLAEFGPYLYAVNARFGTVSDPTVASYDIIQVRR